jgi:hypothetical protein
MGNSTLHMMNKRKQFLKKNQGKTKTRTNKKKCLCEECSTPPITQNHEKQTKEAMKRKFTKQFTNSSQGTILP